MLTGSTQADEWSSKSAIVRSDIARYEGYYASVLYSCFAALGLDVTVEDSSSHGRLDMAVRCNSNVYLFEFKLLDGSPGRQPNSPAEAAEGASAGQTVWKPGDGAVEAPGLRRQVPPPGSADSPRRGRGRPGRPATWRPGRWSLRDRAPERPGVTRPAPRGRSWCCVRRPDCGGAGRGPRGR